MTKINTFLFNSTTWLAIALAIVSNFISIPLVAAAVLLVAVLLLIMAAFQSGRLPLDPGSVCNMRDHPDLDDRTALTTNGADDNVIDVDFGDPKVRAMSWPYVRTSCTAPFFALWTMAMMSRRRPCPFGA